MKKIILVLVVMMVGFSGFSLDHGLITGFEVGYYTLNRTAIHEEYKSSYIDQDSSLSIKLQTGYRIENFRIIGEYTNLMHPISFDNYSPSQDEFTIKVNYTYKEFKIEAWHTCSHPVVANQSDATSKEFTTRGVTVGFYREY